MAQKVEVSVEGKTHVVEAADEAEMTTKIKQIAQGAGLGRFVVKTEDGRKLAPNELGSFEKVRILRTEVAGIVR